MKFLVFENNRLCLTQEFKNEILFSKKESKNIVDKIRFLKTQTQTPLTKYELFFRKREFDFISTKLKFLKMAVKACNYVIQKFSENKEIKFYADQLNLNLNLRFKSFNLITDSCNDDLFEGSLNIITKDFFNNCLDKEKIFKKNHIMLWNYVIKQIEEHRKQIIPIPSIKNMKKKFFHSYGISVIPRNGCYACKYAEDYGEESNFYCYYCPLDCVCCFEPGSPFFELGELVDTNEWNKAIQLSMQIRDSWK